MSTAIMPPEHDLPYYAGLPDAVKVEVGRWFTIIGDLLEADRPTSAAKSIAAKFQHLRGFSSDNILTRYYAYRNTGDWKVLINKSKLPRYDKGLPAEFIAEWHKRCLLNQRKMKPAWRDMIRDWRRGEPMPGYGTWREYWEARRPDITFMTCPDELPPGWKYENLWRYRPEKSALVAARQGRSAVALDFRPQVFSTRVGLKVGQYYVFDDLEHDVIVNVLGVNRRAMRPLELCCLDLYSAYKVAYGLKPTLLDEVADKKIKLKEREMRFLLALVLSTKGYRPDGTVLRAEHGTAAIRDDVERAIAIVTNGKVTVDRSGIEGAAVADGWFEGRGRGNFRFKAALESNHALVHNETAALPGQLGKDRDHAPEELHGLQRYNTYLLNALHALPPEAIEQLKFPAIRFQVFADLYAKIDDHIQARRDHNLQGWEEAGLVTTVFEIGPGLPTITEQQLLSLPEEKRVALRGTLVPVGQRKLSPVEVWRMGVRELVKVPPYLTTEIMGEDLAEERKLGSDLLFEFEDRDIGPGVHRYLGYVQDPDGRQIKLNPDDTYRVYCNPFASGMLIVCNARKGCGGVLGIAPRWTEVSPTDLDSLHRRMGEAKRIEKEILLPVARAGKAKADAMLEMHEHNNAVLRGQPLTGTERENAHHMKRFQPSELTDPERSGEPAPVEPASSDDTVADFSPENLL